jgi:hypothetical protein
MIRWTRYFGSPSSRRSRTSSIYVSVHARRRLEERRITHWQVIDGVRSAEIVENRPDDEPNPSVVVRETLIDGTVVEAVWAWLAESETALLVTVYFT